MRPTIARIHLSHIQHNYSEIRKKVGNSRVCAVVKANAYGHGAYEVVCSLNELDHPPDFYSVAYADEGIALREKGITNPILVFDAVAEYNADDLLRYNLIPTVYNADHLQLLQKSGKSDIRVHIKVDTGMGRVGVPFENASGFVKEVLKSENITIEGIYTHFATSDDSDKTFALLQLERFKQLKHSLEEDGVSCLIYHAANSGAILDIPESYFDMVRAGISLYGYYPSLETTESIPLKHGMSILSKVASVRWFGYNESVSYGQHYFAPKRTQIISVPIGYADGYNRLLTNKISCIIGGNKYPQVGRVTMDRIMFDVGEDTIPIGEEVILLGSDGAQTIDAWDWAKIINTIPYEITCGISGRVPRKYK